MQMTKGSNGGENPPLATIDREHGLVAELESLANQPMCPEAKLLLDMAVDAQKGKAIDLDRLKAKANSARINL